MICIKMTKMYCTFPDEGGEGLAQGLGKLLLFVDFTDNWSVLSSVLRLACRTFLSLYLRAWWNAGDADFIRILHVAKDGTVFSKCQVQTKITFKRFNCVLRELRGWQAAALVGPEFWISGTHMKNSTYILAQNLPKWWQCAQLSCLQT